MLLKTTWVTCLIVFANCQASRSTFNNKIVKLGLTFLTAKEVAPIMICMEDSAYALHTMDEMKGDGVNCALKNLPLAKYGTGMTLVSQLSSCLKPNDAFGLLDDMWPAIKTQIKSLYTAVINAVKKPKSNNKPKAQCIEKGYQKLIAAVTKPFLNTVCTNLKNKLDDTQWGCIKKVGKQVIDFSQYACFND